ncbi:hypothetical protein C8J56DRAFT_935840 [Mycena floridula]|nr:hypothetical protein C8J56DRAFT_935840 [Mycena floridula]
MSIAEMEDVVKSAMQFDVETILSLTDTTEASKAPVLLENESDYAIFCDILDDTQAATVTFEVCKPRLEPYLGPGLVGLKLHLCENRLPDDHPLSTLWKRFWNHPNAVPRIEFASFAMESYKVYAFDIKNLPFLEDTDGKMLVRPQNSEIQSIIEAAYAKWDGSRSSRGAMLLGQASKSLRSLYIFAVNLSTGPALPLIYGTLEALKKGQAVVLYYREVGYFFCPQGVFAASEEMLSNSDNNVQFSEPPFSDHTKILAFADYHVNPDIPPPAGLGQPPFFPVYVAASPSSKLGFQWTLASGPKKVKVPPWTSNERCVLVMLQLEAQSVASSNTSSSTNSNSI